MTAYKFLAKGAVGPISGYVWPSPRGDEPGAWVEVDGPLTLCSQGLHLCRTFDLVYWLHDELWDAESSGERVEGIDCIMVRRARLVRRIDAWNEGGAARFADACVEHAASQATSASSDVREFIADAKLAANHGYVAVSAFSAALAVAKLSPAIENERAFRRERRWQADWITRELIAPQSP